jgi:hypothetical protein
MAALWIWRDKLPKVLAIVFEMTNSTLSDLALEEIKLGVSYVSGTLTLKDNDQIIMTFAHEVTPSFIPNQDTAHWRQSWNLERYIPAIRDKIKSYDIRSITAEWKTNAILFADNSALIFNEHGN